MRAPIRCAGRSQPPKRERRAAAVRTIASIAERRSGARALRRHSARPRSAHIGTVRHFSPTAQRRLGSRRRHAASQSLACTVAGLHRHDGARGVAAASPAFGDKRVSDQLPDACFRDRALHRPRARFATSDPAKRGGGPLVLSPNRRRPIRQSPAAASGRKRSSGDWRCLLAACGRNRSSASGLGSRSTSASACWNAPWKLTRRGVHSCNPGGAAVSSARTRRLLRFPRSTHVIGCDWGLRWPASAHDREFGSPVTGLADSAASSCEAIVCPRL
jgi:hypothetical protein